jgi:hypothetical protein
MSVDLKVDFCSHEAAKYAVEHWHYSKVMPSGKVVKFGVWEDGKFIGAILFSWGANRNIGNPYGLTQMEVCELTRVALDAHISSVSQIVSVSMKRLRVQSPGVRLIVSYADPQQSHVGIVYQAMNWIYEGTSRPQAAVIVGGKVLHKKTAQGRYGTIKGLVSSGITFKHKYLYPLDKAMRRQIEPLAKPYPKRADVGEIESR